MKMSVLFVLVGKMCFSVTFFFIFTAVYALSGASVYHKLHYGGTHSAPTVVGRHYNWKTGIQNFLNLYWTGKKYCNWLMKRFPFDPALWGRMRWRLKYELKRQQRASQLAKSVIVIVDAAQMYRTVVSNIINLLHSGQLLPLNSRGDDALFSNPALGGIQIPVQISRLFNFIFEVKN